MIKINISRKIKETCPELTIGVIECRGTNTIHDPDLWKEITSFENDFRNQFQIEDINKRIAISATRTAYKKLGKDPNRYRPSSEALCRRILRDLPLYQINTFVDLINLVSIRTGYSIGGFDADLICGNLTLDVGEKDEQFEAIGRGFLNIEGLPVYRDEKGPIGTPTSDEERTKIKVETSHMLMIINSYSEKEELNEAINYSSGLLQKYGDINFLDFYVI